MTSRGIVERSKGMNLHNKCANSTGVFVVKQSLHDMKTQMARTHNLKYQPLSVND